jgi:hypothetical protein
MSSVVRTEASKTPEKGAKDYLHGPLGLYYFRPARCDQMLPALSSLSRRIRNEDYKTSL